jgi:predicted aspartyl protease
MSGSKRSTWPWCVGSVLFPVYGLIGGLVFVCRRNTRRRGAQMLAATALVCGLGALGSIPQAPTPAAMSASTRAIQLSVDKGTYRLQASVNGNEPLSFTLDSGASDIEIPSHIIAQMIDKGQIRANDYLGTSTFTYANGAKVEQPLYNLHTVTVGGITLHDVECTAGQDQETFLLGQTFLAKLPSWSIDNTNGRLLIGQ